MLKRTALILFLFFVSSNAFAERVVLKSGEWFDGTIIERTDNYIQIQTGGAPVYLSMDQIQDIIDSAAAPVEPVPQAVATPQLTVVSDPQPIEVQHVPVPTTETEPAPISSEPQPVGPTMINGKDGQFYYSQAKTDFQNGNIKESMQNLYYAASLGVEDSDGLKAKLDKAMTVMQAVEAKKTELKKTFDQLDPGIQSIIYKILYILGISAICFLLWKIFQVVQIGLSNKENDVSPLLKLQHAGLAQVEGLEGFVRAGPNKRVCAFLIDSCVIAVPCLAVQFWAGPMFSTLTWLVFLLIKDCINGQSLGKKIVSIQVVDMDNKPVGPNQALMRNLFWVAVCVLPLFHPYLAFGSAAIILYEFVALIQDQEGQRFGDKMSLTRVYDLKPHLKDWTFILFSLLAVMVWIGVYSVSAYVLAKVFHRSDLLVVQQEFRDPSSRFTMRIPSDFQPSKEIASENVYVFNKADGSQSVTVLVLDKPEIAQFSKDRFDEMVTSFLALQLGTDPKTILASAHMSHTIVAGNNAAVFSYDTDQGKAVSVFLIKGTLLFEVGFLFKRGDVDQTIITKLLLGFRVLT